MELSDLELLELAAKPAGLVPRRGQIHWPLRFICLKDGKSDDGGWTYWNPLADDGDALRLAVKLRLDVDIGSKRAEAVFSDKDGATWGVMEESCENGDNMFTATRRAIVIAASELGKAMP